MVSKRKVLSIDEKVSLILAIEKGGKKSCIGKRFGLSHSTVGSIWKNKEKILQAGREGKCCKKLKKPKYENLDQAVLSWYKEQSKNMQISGPMIKAKAEKCAQKLGNSEFKASEGWLGKFKQRHRINFGKTSEANLGEETMNVDTSDDEDEGDPDPPPTIQQALDAAKLLANFLLFYEDDPVMSRDMDRIYERIQSKYLRTEKR